MSLDMDQEKDVKRRFEDVDGDDDQREYIIKDDSIALFWRSLLSMEEQPLLQL